jgi:cytoskeletal protein CcmA (bactofilin family)
MGKRRRQRFPHYRTLVGPGTEITGSISFEGGLHLDGRVIGDVTARDAEEGGLSAAVSIAATGVIEGNLDAPHVLIDGTVIGDVRAAVRAVLASGARIEGTLYYGALEMDRGAEVNGKLVHTGGGAASQTADGSAIQDPAVEPEAVALGVSGSGAEGQAPGQNPGST